MEKRIFPVIDPVKTGANIRSLRCRKGLTVRDLQAYFGFDTPQAIYKWQKGLSLPTVDNLLALSVLLEVPMEQILIRQTYTLTVKQQEFPAASSFLGIFYLLNDRLAYQHCTKKEHCHCEPVRTLAWQSRPTSWKLYGIATPV